MSINKINTDQKPLLKVVNFKYTTSHYNNKSHYRVLGRLLER